MQTFTPIGRVCLILPQQEIPKTKSGIILIENKESASNFGHYQHGVVIKKGTIPTSEFHERDTVMFPRGCGIVQDINDVKYLLVKYDDITAITY